MIYRSSGGARDHLTIDCGFLKANNPDVTSNQGSNILVGAEAKFGLTLTMAVVGQGSAAPLIAKRVLDGPGNSRSDV